MMGVINQTRDPINRVIPLILSIIEAVIPGKHSMEKRVLDSDEYTAPPHS